MRRVRWWLPLPFGVDDRGGSRPPRATVRRKETREVGRVERRWAGLEDWGGLVFFSFSFIILFFVGDEREREKVGFWGYKILSLIFIGYTTQMHKCTSVAF